MGWYFVKKSSIVVVVEQSIYPIVRFLYYSMCETYLPEYAGLPCLSMI